MILDIGPDTAARYAELIAKAGTVVWNGPVGVFEFDAFGKGTETLARAIAASKAFSIAGGGDTLAAVDKYGIADEVRPKIHLARGGAAAMEALAKGEVEIGLTFVSEILTEPGVEAVGPLPASISTPTSLVAFVSSHAKNAAAARALVKYLSSPDAAPIYKNVGMQPAPAVATGRPSPVK